jgi:hypothetical protein
MNKKLFDELVGTNMTLPLVPSMPSTFRSTVGRAQRNSPVARSSV